VIRVWSQKALRISRSPLTGFAELPEALKGLFNVGRFSLDLYRDKIALPPVLARSQLEWHMDDDLGPDRNSMIVYPFLVFLFDNRIAGQRGSESFMIARKASLSIEVPCRGRTFCLGCLPYQRGRNGVACAAAALGTTNEEAGLDE